MTHPLCGSRAKAPRGRPRTAILLDDNDGGAAENMAVDAVLLRVSFLLLLLLKDGTEVVLVLRFRGDSLRGDGVTAVAAGGLVVCGVLLATARR